MRKTPPKRRSPPQRTIPAMPRPRPSIMVEGSAILDGQPVWLLLGQGHILSTAAGKKLCVEMGATPHAGKFYLSMTDVRQLDLLDQEDATVEAPPLPHRPLH